MSDDAITFTAPEPDPTTPEPKPDTIVAAAPVKPATAKPKAGKYQPYRLGK